MSQNCYLHVLEQKYQLPRLRHCLPSPSASLPLAHQCPWSVRSTENCFYWLSVAKQPPPLELAWTEPAFSRSLQVRNTQKTTLKNNCCWTDEFPTFPLTALPPSVYIYIYIYKSVYIYTHVGMSGFSKHMTNNSLFS